MTGSKLALRLQIRTHTLVVWGMILLFLVARALAADWDMEAIEARANSLYGQEAPGAHQRIQAWQQLLLNQRTQGKQAQLEAVNHFFNQQIKYAEDSDIDNRVDYWATPIESLRAGRGDCEDYAIAKYITLRQLGVPEEELQITYVKALRYNRAHMVLTWYASPTATPLVLDSLMDKILPASQRNDLIPVYSFNNSGMWLPGSQGNKRVGDSKRLSRWQDVLGKMQKEGFPVNEQE